MENYFSKKKIGGQINSKISNQDSLAAVYAVEQLNEPDIFKFGVEFKEFSIQCECDDDISIANKDNKIFIQVKSVSIDDKKFYEVMDSFLENNTDNRECFFVLAIFENFKVNNKNIIDRLKAYRNLYMDKNETEEKKSSVKAEFIKDFKLEKYVDIVDRFVIDSRPLFRDNRDTSAIFSRYLRLAYGFKDQKEHYINQIYNKLVFKMGELRANRSSINNEEIEEIIGRELVKDSVFNQFSMISGYKKVDNGYVKNDDQSKRLIRIENGFKIAYKSIMRDWRKVYFKEFVRSIFLGAHKCAKCGHPMVANLCGLRGIACPDCGYNPYVTIFSFCECGAYDIIKTQPEMEGSKMLNYLNDYYNYEEKICKNCAKPLFDEYFEVRIMILPIPYPLNKYEEINDIYSKY